MLCLPSENADHITVHIHTVLSTCWALLASSGSQGSEASLCRQQTDQTVDAQTDLKLHCAHKSTHVCKPRHKKTCLQGLRPGKTQTGLLSYRG